MSAFLIFHATVKQPDTFQEYAAGAAGTLAAYDGVVARRGKLAAVLHGDHGHDTVGILEFPDMARAESWYRSPEYQALLATRDAAADVTVLGFESPPA
jgi:uncharacterized protein (DUF1330 family)